MLLCSSHLLVERIHGGDYGSCPFAGGEHLVHRGTVISTEPLVGGNALLKLLQGLQVERFVAIAKRRDLARRILQQISRFPKRLRQVLVAPIEPRDGLEPLRGSAHLL